MSPSYYKNLPMKTFPHILWSVLTCVILTVCMNLYTSSSFDSKLQTNLEASKSAAIAECTIVVQREMQKYNEQFNSNLIDRQFPLEIRTKDVEKRMDRTDNILIDHEGRIQTLEDKND